jgi:hypothetical protein
MEPETIFDKKDFRGWGLAWFVEIQETIVEGIEPRRLTVCGECP